MVPPVPPVTLLSSMTYWKNPQPPTSEPSATTCRESRCDVRDGEGWRGWDRTDEARERHENHGDRGSSWIAALRQHACRQSPRSSAGTAVLRLLHGRGQAGEFDRRSRLRQRSTR